MRKHTTYRHMSCIDLDMHIVKIQYFGPKYVKLKVVFINQRNPDLIYGPPVTVKVQREDLWKWEIVC